MEYRNECFRQLQRDRAANARARQMRANAAVASGSADDSSSHSEDFDGNEGPFADELEDGFVDYDDDY